MRGFHLPVVVHALGVVPQPLRHARLFSISESERASHATTDVLTEPVNEGASKNLGEYKRPSHRVLAREPSSLEIARSAILAATVPIQISGGIKKTESEKSCRRNFLTLDKNSHSLGSNQTRITRDTFQQAKSPAR